MDKQFHSLGFSPSPLGSPRGPAGFPSFFQPGTFLPSLPEDPAAPVLSSLAGAAGEKGT